MDSSYRVRKEVGMSYKLYDAEIEYLKTLGNADCYIDIPMVHNSFFKKEFEFKREDSGGSYDVVVASYTEVSFVFWNSLSRYVANLSGKEFNLYVYGSEGKKVKVIAKQPKVSLIVDGRTTEQTFGIEQSKTSNIFRLFSSVKNRHGVISIYYFKAWDESDNLVLDLIPVRVGNVGYLFDKVSMKLFGNAGTGSFVLGPDVAPGRYANEVAFLESWGNQYIDTGIKPSTDTKIELKCLYCKSGAGLTNYGALIGADDRDNAYILNHSAVANFTYGLEFSNNFANPQTRLLTFDSTTSPQNMRVYDEGGSLVTTLTCLRGVFEVNQNLYLFAANRSGTPVYGSNRILYCKIYDGDTLVRDYVPVEYNGTGYMYDKVSGLFFDNQGTGKFLFGSIAKACARSYSRRQLMASKLPYDAEVVYLEIPKSTNSPTVRAYINTGYIETPGFGFYVEAYGNGNYQGGVNFAAIGNDTTYYTATDFTVLKKSGAGTGYGFRNAPGNYNIKFVWEIIQNNNTATYRVKRNNSETSGTITVGDFTETELPILIGYGRTNSVASKKTSGGFYLYRVVFYEYQTIVRDFIPVRVGNVGYMYDKVSGKLFGNAGTGNFILGPDKNI